MRCANLSDDQLWRVIAQNTNAMSLLFEEHKRADLMRSHLETATKLD